MVQEQAGVVVYGIPSCSSCREARKWLDGRGIAYRFHDLRDDGLGIQMLERWAARVEWEKLLNRSSLTWRRLPDVDRDGMSRDKAFASMIEYPTLVKRPVLERGNDVVVGFSAKQYAGLFSTA